MKKSFYWSAVIIAMLFVAGLVTHRTLAQSEEQSQPEQAPVEESNPAINPETGSDDQGDIEDSEEGDSEEGDESDESSDGEVEGATFAAFRGGGHDDDDDDNGHINICHILGNGGYNQISVSKSGNLNGHNNHGADIIPPFEKDGPDYPGKNWTTEGQAIWNNGCQVPPETGSITIVKQVVGAGDQEVPTEWSFDFSGDLGDFSLTNEKNSKSEGDLKPGHFTVTEGELGDNWTLTDITCDGGEVSENGNSVGIDLGEDGDVTCTFTNTYRKPEVPSTTVTLHAQKIVCDDESDLPNWGAGNVVGSIDADTASDWMNDFGSNLGCHLADWNFQWGYATQTSDPDDGLEDAGTGWTTFSGSALIDVANENDIRVRESADADYIGFTGQNTDQDVSAEVYCGSDVLHYDNWEWMDDVVAGQDYYCVAWNVPVEKDEACRVQVVSQTGDEGVGNGNAVAAWIHSSWTHALESVATWIWDTPEVVDASQTEAKTFTKDFYVDGPVNDAMLKLAADNRYWITINGNEVASNTGELNYGAVTGPIDVKVTGNIQSGWNTITMKVENIGLEGYEQRPHDNPAAGIYELVINAGAENLCKEPPVDTTSDVTICKYDAQENLLSGWDVWLGPWAQDDFKASAVVDDYDYEGTTGENGCVTIDDVQYGSYRLDELMKDGWVNVSGAGSHVVVDEPTETFNLVNTLACNPEVNLLANGGFETPVLASNTWSIFTSPTALLEWLTGSEGIEIQNYVAGTPFAGQQLAELDPNHPTTIWQDVATVPGYTYRLETQYSPRPGRDAEDNRFEFRVDGSALGASIARDGSANSDTVWTLESRTFVAASSTTSVGFAEVGTDTSYGAYLDEVGLYCIPEPVDTHNTVKICKYEVNDEEGENNPGLPGWTVGLNAVDSDTEREYEGVTGQDGCVTFADVDLAQYYVEETMQDGWEFFSGPTGLQNIDSDQGTYTFNIINRRIHGDDDDDDDNAPELTLAKSGIYDNETGTITFTLDWSVTGEGTIYDVVVTDPVPAGTNFVSADNWGFLSGSDVVWNLGDVTAPDSGSVSFTVSLDEVAAIGFYADGYSDNLQGTRKDASAINLDRTDPNIALGAPQSAGLSNDAPVVAGSFFALGFSEAPAVGGSIVLTFSTPVMNGAGNDLKVFEVTGGTYPDEVVQVEAWDIATAAWVNLGNVTRDGEVDLGSVLTTNQIRLTDVSTKALFPNDGDGYDVDALQAYYTVGSVCSVDNTATISGSEEGEVKKVAQTYDQDGYDFYASASTTVTVNEKACEPGDDDDDDDDDDDNGDDDDDFEEHIIVRKQVTEGSSTEGSFEFDPSWGENFSVAVNDQHDSGDLEPGWYSVSEVIPSGWGLDSSYCYSSEEQPKKLIYDDEVINPSEFYLSEGETVTCVFTNDQNDEPTGGDDTPNTNDTPRSSHRRSGSSNRGEVLGASTENNFCPFLRDYQHINMQNDPSEVNKAKAFFNSYLGLNLALDGIFDQSMFGAVVQFQNMFKQDVLDTWTEEYPGVLDDNATGYLYQTTKWKINSIICPGYETFPDKLIMAPGTTVR